MRSVADIIKAWSAEKYSGVMLPGLGSMTCGEAASVLSDLASSTSAGVTEEQTGTFAGGLKAAVKFVRKRLDDYVAEHGMYDPETGATEFPGNGDETVCEWEEIIEGLEALKEIKP